MKNLQNLFFRHRAPFVSQLLQNRPQTAFLFTQTHSHQSDNLNFNPVTSAPTYTHIWQKEPGFALASSIDKGVCDQAQDVGVVKHLMHLHLRLSLLATFTVMTQDPLQGIEASVLHPLHKINITEPTERRDIRICPDQATGLKDGELISQCMSLSMSIFKNEPVSLLKIDHLH